MPAKYLASTLTIFEGLEFSELFEHFNDDGLDIAEASLHGVFAELLDAFIYVDLTEESFIVIDSPEAVKGLHDFYVFVGEYDAFSVNGRAGSGMHGIQRIPACAPRKKGKNVHRGRYGRH